MAINIVAMLKSQIGSQIAGQVGKRFGESETATKSGIEAMIPTVLGGLLKQVSAPGGAEKLDRTITDGGFDGSLLDNLSGIFTGGGSDKVAQQGGDLVSMIFGDKIGMIAPILAKFSGLKSGSITSILAMVAPLIISFLGKQKASMGLDANGLANLLTSQKDSIGAALPPGISDAMGLGALGIASPAATRTAAPVATRSAAPVAASTGGGGLAKILIPLLLLAGLGYWAYTYIFDGIRPTGEAGNVVIDASEFPQDPTYDGDSSMSAPATVMTEDPDAAAAGGMALPDMAEMPGMAEMPDMKSMFASMTGAIEKVTDAESAKAALPELESMNTKLEGVTSKLGLMPQAMKSKVVDSIKTMAPELESMLDEVMAIPGVKAVLQPIVDKVMAQIKPLMNA